MYREEYNFSRMVTVHIAVGITKLLTVTEKIGFVVVAKMIEVVQKLIILMNYFVHKKVK